VFDGHHFFVILQCSLGLRVMWFFAIEALLLGSGYCQFCVGFDDSTLVTHVIIGFFLRTQGTGGRCFGVDRRSA